MSGRATCVLAAALAAGCNQVFGLEPPRGAAGPDAADLDAASITWSAPRPIGVAAALDAAETEPTLSADQLELYFAVQHGPFVRPDLYRATRATATAAWGQAIAVLALDTPATDGGPRLTADGLRLYFASDWPGGPGGSDIWAADRATPTTDAWLAVALHTGLSTTADERTAAPCQGRERFVVAATGVDPATHDLFEYGAEGSRRALDELNSAADERGPFVTEDCLTVYFGSNRAGSFDLYVATRASVFDTWSAPARIDELATDADETEPWVSADQRHLVFTLADAGSSDVVESFR